VALFKGPVPAWWTPTCAQVVPNLLGGHIDAVVQLPPPWPPM
jgi:hypothetical protein